ncbi:MAG: hypothetical protein SGI88_22590 [Candidatus Hydrogenedentes bacterium]|nr:hypothetical protein [Candidatus Hydrogenedentota bacterium]
MRINDLNIEEVVDLIVSYNTSICTFWSNSHGWAPKSAADLMSKSRLDWQISLSHSLALWIQPTNQNQLAALQILGYANLGALIEGTMKLFLSVYYENYAIDIDAVTRKGDVQGPEVLNLESLRQFFKRRIWSANPSDQWDSWINHIQYRRNAIHAFKSREVGDLAGLHDDIRLYLRFLDRINGQLPYPDNNEGPTPSFDLRLSETWSYDAPVITPQRSGSHLGDQ